MAKTSAVVDLRERCVTEALAIIQEQGVEQLSLRDVARRLGVSHQAPYKHYANRDALLAEVVARELAVAPGPVHSGFEKRAGMAIDRKSVV